MATTTAPATTIVDNRAGVTASIGALKAFLRALGAAYAVEGRPTPGSPRGRRRESWAPPRGRSRG